MAHHTFAPSQKLLFHVYKIKFMNLVKNSVQLIGNLGKDPEMTSLGQKII